MIAKAIEKSIRTTIKKGWDKNYWAFDIHETILKPNWQVGNLPTEFYPMAKETLQLISDRKEIVMMLYTCSHPDEIERYLRFFNEHGICFDYANENPEIPSQGYGYYEKKPYFNVLFEDKAGFDPVKDWQIVYDVVTTMDSLLVK